MILPRVGVSFKGWEWTGGDRLLYCYFFPKGLENLIHFRLCKFHYTSWLVTGCQFVFRKRRSTEHALLVQTDFIPGNFECKLLTFGIFFNFTKAFESINHEILYDKLECYGARGHVLYLLKSYFCNRPEFVNVDECSSSRKLIINSVRTGSILVHFCFCFY